MAPCSCADISRLEMREAIALGVAGIDEMSMALGVDCSTCRGLAPADEAPRRPNDALPLDAYGRNDHPPAPHWTRLPRLWP